MYAAQTSEAELAELSREHLEQVGAYTITLDGWPKYQIIARFCGWMNDPTILEQPHQWSYSIFRVHSGRLLFITTGGGKEFDTIVEAVVDARRWLEEEARIKRS